jgi:hypothetical protein
MNELDAADAEVAVRVGAVGILAGADVSTLDIEEESVASGVLFGVGTPAPGV